MCKALIDYGRLLWVCERLGLPHPGPRAFSSSAASGTAPASGGASGGDSASTAAAAAGSGDGSSEGPAHPASGAGWAGAGCQAVAVPCAGIVAYIQPEVSGENKLLLARLR